MGREEIGKNRPCIEDYFILIGKLIAINRTQNIV